MRTAIYCRSKGFFGDSSVALIAADAGRMAMTLAMLPAAIGGVVAINFAAH